MTQDEPQRNNKAIMCEDFPPDSGGKGRMSVSGRGRGTRPQGYGEARRVGSPQLGKDNGEGGAGVRREPRAGPTGNRGRPSQATPGRAPRSGERGAGDGVATRSRRAGGALRRQLTPCL